MSINEYHGRWLWREEGSDSLGWILTYTQSAWNFPHSPKQARQGPLCVGMKAGY